MAVLAAYFDESVRLEASEPLCVGGYVFKPAQYARFTQRWQREVLKLPNRRRLRHFHMTDLCAGRGVYEGLSIKTRLGVLERAVQIIESQTYAAVAAYFDQAEFERVAPPEWAEYRGSIYSSACHLCIQTTAFWLRDWRVPLDVLYVFERGHKYQAEAEDILRAIAGSPDARSHFRYRNHLFEEKDKEAGLQAADLLSWTITKANVLDGTPPPALRPFVPLMDRLVRANPQRTKVSTFTGDKLRRFIVESLVFAEERGLPVTFRNRKRGLK